MAKFRLVRDDDKAEAKQTLAISVRHQSTWLVSVSGTPEELARIRQGIEDGTIQIRAATHWEPDWELTGDDGETVAESKAEECIDDDTDTAGCELVDENGKVIG